MTSSYRATRSLISRRSTWAIAFVLLIAACSTSGESTPSDPSASPTAPPPTTSPPEVIVDPESHSFAALGSRAEFDLVARAGVGEQSVLKFSITEFSTAPELVWLDGNFYDLHDEWYWFQLLNGVAVRGFDAEPVGSLEGQPGGFESIEEVYAWADDNRDALPLDLRFTSLDRLYSPTFYESALDSSAGRRLGVGSLIRTPDPVTGDARWVIELEFSDEVTAEQVDTYFDVVANALPADVADELAWVPRSRAQELVASEIEDGGGPNASRIVRYEELSTPGDIEVYSPAIAAGRLLVVTDGGRWSLSDAGPNDIVAIDRAPDDLPQGNGLITGTPQTPLAHVNILALNRGVPNAFLAGLADDPTITQLGRVRAPVLVRTTADGELDVIALTDDEYDGWLATQGKAPIGVPSVEVGVLAITEDLDALADRTPTATALGELRPIIGGKAAGFIELAVPGTTTMPPDPMAITIRPYVEHMEQYRATIDALLDDSALDSVRGRYLFLEGRDDYDDRYTSDRDSEFADEFTASHPAGTPLGDALAADGFVRYLRDGAIDPATLDAITTDLAANFAGYAPEQGIRFRSSSTVEDIEGFNGAGLYDSNTGYFDPTVLPDEDDHKRTIERAILRTWSSYWNATAFEERQRENIDHRSGAMAILVHARFDDPLEVSNGVATFTIAPDPVTAARMVINVQAGDTSVTNADNEDGLLPEVVAVTVSAGGGDPSIDRVSASSITAPDDVLDDQTVLALFAEVDAVAQSWLDRANAERPEAARSTSLTLDIEFRQMDAGWPARLGDVETPSRMVVKQARTLDPGLRGVPADVLALPIPRDVLAHALSVVQYTCTTDGEATVGYEVTTDPFAAVDLGYAESPLEMWDVEPPADPGACTQRDLLTRPTQYLLDLLATR